MPTFTQLIAFRATMQSFLVLMAAGMAWRWLLLHALRPERLAERRAGALVLNDNTWRQTSIAWLLCVFEAVGGALFLAAWLEIADLTEVVVLGTFWLLSPMGAWFASLASIGDLEIREGGLLYRRRFKSPVWFVWLIPWDQISRVTWQQAKRTMVVHHLVGQEKIRLSRKKAAALLEELGRRVAVRESAGEASGAG
jgi:hypothetical protein